MSIFGKFMAKPVVPVAGTATWPTTYPATYVPVVTGHAFVASSVSAGHYPPSPLVYEYVISWDRAKPPIVSDDGVVAGVLSADIAKALASVVATPTAVTWGGTFGMGGTSSVPFPTYSCKCGKDMGHALVGTVRRCANCGKESAFVHDAPLYSVHSSMIFYAWLLLEAR